jgi:hypothetical protein
MTIEPIQWRAFLAELSRQAEGYQARVEILSEELGDQVEVHGAPLLEVTYDPREGIAVSVGDRAGHGELVRHVVSRPLQLEITDEPGVPAALMILDETGTRTLVRLSAP